jgi:hypothetical protein
MSNGKGRGRVNTKAGVIELLVLKSLLFLHDLNYKYINNTYTSILVGFIRIWFGHYLQTALTVGCGNTSQEDVSFSLC